MEATNDKIKTGAIHMTSGSLWKNIFLFSVPLMLAQILEIMFNMSDVAVVGKFSSYQALGSVGSTTLLITLFTGILIGMGSGVNVRVAHKLGAQDKKAVSQSVHTAFVLCLATGLLIGILCILFAGGMLSLMNTKPELLDGAVLYMKIYALGMPAMAVYNCGNGVLNVLLNLFFVIRCHMAAEGVALASVIAQYISAFLIVHHLLKRTDGCRLFLSKLRIHKDAARAILMLGIPAGIQNGIFAIANIFVQVGVNSFVAVMVSGNAAAANADALIFNVMAAFYTGCASFISRNRGAGNKKRMLNSYLVSLFYSFAAGLILGILLLVFGKEFLSLFATKQAVIDAGMERIRIMALSYCISAFMDCSIAASRGIGKSVVPTVVVILGSCVFRIVWIYTVFAHFHTIPSLYLLYFFSWSITSVAEVLYFVFSFRGLKVRL